MRSSTKVTTSQRLRHWVVAVVAAVVATVWVVMTLVVPSQAEDHQPVTASLNVDLAGGSRAGTASFPLMPGKLREAAGYYSLKGVKYGRNTGTEVHYNSGAIGYCGDPGLPGTNGHGKGNQIFIDPSRIDEHMAPGASYYTSESMQRTVKAVAALYAQNPSFASAVWQGVIWSIVKSDFSLTFTNSDHKAQVQQLVEQAKAKAHEFETNSELLKSLRLTVADGAAGHKIVKLEGSEQAKAALAASKQGMSSTINVTVNGKKVSGTVAQALGDGIDVEVACQGGGTIRLFAEWSGMISLTGAFTAVEPSAGRDQIKVVVTPAEIAVHGSAEVEVPCAPTIPDTPEEPTEPPAPTTPTTPATPTTPTTPVTPGKPTTPATPTTPETPATPVTPLIPAIPATPEEPEDPQPKGQLVIAKKVVAAEGAEFPAKFGFNYVCGEKSGSIEVAADAEARIEDIAAGATCTVTEKPATAEGFEQTVSWKIDGVPATADAFVDSGVKVKVQGKKTVSVEATNTYTRPTGEIRVSKHVADSANLAQGRKFSFPYVCATGAGADTKVGEGTLNFGANDQGAIRDIPAGASCVISEADATVEGAKLATTWTAGGNSATVSEVVWGGVTLTGIKTAPVVKGVTAEVVATNTYMPVDKAGFVIAKQVTGADSAQLAGAKFAFDYSCQAGDGLAKTGRFEVSAGQQFSTLEEGVELPRDARCTVTERPVSTSEGIVFNGVTFNRTSGSGEFRSDHAGSRVIFTLGNEPLLFTAVNSFESTKPVKPEAKTILGTVNGGKQISADNLGEIVTLVDTIRYTNLVAGTEYVADGRLVSPSGEDLGVSAYATFTPEGEIGKLVNGTTEVTFEVSAAVVRANTALTAFEKIWPASKVTVIGGNVQPKAPGDKPVAEHEVPDDKDQTVKVIPPLPAPTPVQFALTKVVEGVDAGDRTFNFTLMCEGYEPRAVQIAAGKRQVVEANAGALCKLTETDATIDGIEPALLFAGKGIEVTSHEGIASFTVPATASTATVEVIAKNVYPTSDRPAPEIGTVATNANADEGDNYKTIEVGRDGFIRDVVSWKNLEAGTYTVMPALKRAEGGVAKDVNGVTTAPVTFTVNEGEMQGEVVAELRVPAGQIVPGAKFVVFEKVYNTTDVTSTGPNEGAIPVISHEDINDEGQTVETVTPSVVPSTLVIEKVALDSQGKQIDAEFSFDLTCRAGKDIVEKKGLKVRSGERSENIVVPSGAACEITENASQATLKGKQPALSFSTNDRSVVVSEKGFQGSFTMPRGDSAAIVVKATNIYPEWEVPPSIPPATPDTPGTPEIPSTPMTPCVPSTPNTSGTPGIPGTPDMPGVPVECAPALSTSAVDGADGDKVLAAGVEAVVVDHVSFSGFAAGDYVIVGSLMDKASGQVVAGSRMVAPVHVNVGSDDGSGVLTVEFRVPAERVAAGVSWVVFERAYLAGDVDSSGRVREGAVPYVVHEDLGDGDQTVSVARPVVPSVEVPRRPGVMTPPVRSIVIPPHSGLASTGVEAGVVGVVGLSIIVAGLGLVGLRRRLGGVG